MTRIPVNLAFDPGAVRIMAPDSFRDYNDQPLPPPGFISPVPQLF